MATTDVTPYSTAIPFVAAIPSWLNVYDAQRIASYGLYDDMFRNHPDTLQLLLRGTDDKPIYVPTAKRLVNTVARYVLRDWGFNIVAADDPTTGLPLAPSDEEINAAIGSFGILFKRNRILTQVKSAKKDALLKGDGLLYIFADPEKPQGSRISIKAIDPRIYFPITEEHDPDRVIGQDLVETYTVGDAQFLKRQRFIKSTHPEHPNYLDYAAPIARSVEYIMLDDWEDPDKVKAYTGDLGGASPSVPMETLDGIFTLPVYHLRNNEVAGNPFGVSDVAGLESLIAGINQGMSDQDLAMAMAGLGFYATDSGSPIDDDDNDVDWIIGPQQVVEIGVGKKFERISGVGNVEPSKIHIEMLESRAHTTLGLNDVALGNVDATVAESGIALALRMAPLLDATKEKDESFIEILDQMLYDLRSWFAVYEGMQMPNVVAVSVTGDKLPLNRKERMEELKNLYLDGIITLEFFHEQLETVFGFQLPPGMMAELMDGAARMAQETGNVDPDAEADEEEDADI